MKIWHLASLLTLLVMTIAVPLPLESTESDDKRASIKPVLLLLTSHGELGETGRNTGYYVPEAAHPWRVFTAAKVPVVFASTRGGKPPHDGLKLDDPEVKEFWENPTVQQQLASTAPVAAVNPDDYSAVLVVGGHGTMWDLPDNRAVQELLAAMYQSGKVVAAVCHGPAALVNVKLSDGSYLVAFKTIASFTNQEERAVELADVVPFLLETKLLERGAYIKKAPNFEKLVVTDGRLVTGQNPASARMVAEEVLRLIASGQH